MKYLKYLVLLIAILGYFGYVYAQSNTEVDRIDPVYDRDWYARYGISIMQHTMYMVRLRGGMY